MVTFLFTLRQNSYFRGISSIILHCIFKNKVFCATCLALRGKPLFFNFFFFLAKYRSKSSEWELTEWDVTKTYLEETKFLNASEGS